MNLLDQKIWLESISGIIPGSITAKDLAMIANINQDEAKALLHQLSTGSIGRLDGDIMEFNEDDKLRVAILALQNGIPIEDIAKKIDWRDFEGLAARVLESRDFLTTRNVILTKPRMEIDVIGTKLGIAILIDCKHWKKHGQYALNTAVKKQVLRTKYYVAKTNMIAAPVIVTLYQDKIRFIDKVPIVPIFQLASFLDEFYGNLENITTIETKM